MVPEPNIEEWRQSEQYKTWNKWTIQEWDGVLRRTKAYLLLAHQFSIRRFWVLTAVIMKSTIFWDITLCSPLKVNRRFGGIYRLHLQGRISRARNQRENRWQAEPTCFHAGFLLGLFFDPQDEVDVFPRNVGWLSVGINCIRWKTSIYFYQKMWLCM
jgi:hypothetical protein